MKAIRVGVIGVGMTLIFLDFGGPDLAMTQLAIETLSVILFVFVLYRLPGFRTLSDAATRIRDGIVAVAGGALLAGVAWSLTGGGGPGGLSAFYGEESHPAGKGANVVNVILVDFRALDTLGEITVLAIAALGVIGLMRLRAGRPAE